MCCVKRQNNVCASEKCVVCASEKNSIKLSQCDRRTFEDNLQTHFKQGLTYHITESKTNSKKREDILNCLYIQKKIVSVILSSVFAI